MRKASMVRNEIMQRPDKVSRTVCSTGRRARIKVKLDADASNAAGPVGRTAADESGPKLHTDILRSPGRGTQALPDGPCGAAAR